MAGRVTVAAPVSIDPERAIDLWRDLGRWPSFVEGLARVDSSAAEWPAEGSKVVWSSIPQGRGRVTEKVLESGARSFATRVMEERLLGTQRARAAEAPEGARLELELEYELTQGGALRGVVDVLFVRRALRDALQRTLDRFAVEAEEEAGLRDRADG